MTRQLTNDGDNNALLHVCMGVVLLCVVVDRCRARFRYTNLLATNKIYKHV